MSRLHLLCLPAELLVIIISFMDIEDVASLIATSRTSSQLLIPLIANHLSPNSESILTGAIVCKYRHLLPQLLPHMKLSHINAQDSIHQMSALHHAAYLSDSKSVSLLLEYGADPTLRGHGGSTALHIAALGRGSVIPLLLSCPTVDINAPNEDGATPLHFACSRNRHIETELLLQHGADPNIFDNESWTPLHAAAFKGNYQVVRSLLKTPNTSAPVDVYVRDRGSLTPLHYASFRGHLNTVQLLLEHGVNPNVSDPVRLEPLCAAASAGNTKIVDTLLRAGATGICNAFCCAAAHGHVAVVTMLLEHEKAPSIGTRFSYSLVMAARRGYADMLRCLLRSAFKIGDQEKRCLVAAAGAGKVECVKVCLEECREIEGGWREHVEAALRVVPQNEDGSEIKLLLMRYLNWEESKAIPACDDDGDGELEDTGTGMEAGVET